jgi:hypothetical protein
MEMQSMADLKVRKFSDRNIAISAKDSGLAVELKHQAKDVSIGSSMHVRTRNHCHMPILLTIAMQSDQKRSYKS